MGFAGMMYNLGMTADSKLGEFIDKGLAAGVPHTVLVGMLSSQGWAEKDVYAALAEHFGRTTGIEIPRRAGAGTSAKEAFFYLLIFATLATWTIGLGFLAFALIDRWLADPLFSQYGQAFDTSTITSSLAALIVAFPLYLLISRAVRVEVAGHPEKADSSIRKWLTYMALVIAAGVFMGDLIAALAYLLRGEITSRFVAKSLVVLGLSGGVFWYYFGGLRRTEETDSSRDRGMAWGAAAVVAVAIVLGFLQLGSPREQRKLQADTRRVQALSQMSRQVETYWATHAKQLPANLEQLPGGRTVDPITGAAYEYRPGQGSRYELCAVFARGSEARPGAMGPDQWAHGPGRHCFALDATEMMRMMPYPQ